MLKQPLSKWSAFSVPWCFGVFHTYEFVQIKRSIGNKNLQIRFETNLYLFRRFDEVCSIRIIYVKITLGCIFIVNNLNG